VLGRYKLLIFLLLDRSLVNFIFVLRVLGDGFLFSLGVSGAISGAISFMFLDLGR
jgi:hypothetical protein